MGLNPKISTPSTVRRMKRRSPSNSTRKLSKHQNCRRGASHIDRGASVSDKLDALKSLIPCHRADTKPDQLFEETADYIVLLKTQVFVLQKLVDIYGSNQSQSQEESNSV